jgi:hypothetical protein
MNGSWCAKRSAALLNSATRDALRGLLIGHQAGFDGDTSTRGGLGAEFCAMTGRYWKGISKDTPLSLLY